MILEGLTFDDVLLVPKYSNVKSRATDINLELNIGKIKFKHPIIPANMKTVTDVNMSYAVVKSGGLAILHRFMPIEAQLELAKAFTQNIFSDLEDPVNHFAVSVGVKENDKEDIRNFYNVGVRIFCIDIAHGHSAACIEMVQWMKMACPNILLIAGNVATGKGARDLWASGADVVKAGVGPGSLCTTRIETGNGVPQLTCIMDVAEAKKNYKSYLEQMGSDRQIYFIADGGIKNAGDCVKALCYADMVMAGNVFAGCEETPGEVFNLNGIPHKQYTGSSTHKANRIEGVAAFVPCKGKFIDILKKLTEGIESGCSYQGAHSLTELKADPQFVRITNAGLKESHPHDVVVQ
jgi:IMP dehydrogenase